MRLEWRPVPEYETWYEVSNYGDVRSLDRVVYIPCPHSGDFRACCYKGRVLRPKTCKNGYLAVCLSKSGVRRMHHVHSLVAAAFLGPRPEEHQVLHGDGIATNNVVTNLRYDTPAENYKERTRHRRERGGA